MSTASVRSGSCRVAFRGRDSPVPRSRHPKGNADPGGRTHGLPSGRNAATVVAIATDAAPRRFPQQRFRRPPGATELLLVRHGESEALVPGHPFPLVDGHGDPALAPEGEEQAERVGERLARLPIDAIYVTTLRRTHQTAAPLAARLGLRPMVEPDLREVHLGEWEGELYRQRMSEGHPTALQMLVEQRWDVIPGAETAEHLRQRVRGAVDRIVAAHPDQRVVAVVHGGVIAEIMAQAVDTPHAFAFLGADNASISHLVVFGQRWIVRRFNDTSHLADDLDLDPAPAPLES